jgi:hypothetical protein
LVGPSAEDAYWFDRAALLDPLAYEDIPGGVWSRTVPEGEAWYLVAGGSLNWGSGRTTGYLREYHVDSSVVLPSGTTFGSATNRTASAYVCQPARMASDPRYQYPRDLYFERHARLKTLELREIRCDIDNGAPHGTMATAMFPADFEYGMIVAASVLDACWVVIGPGRNLMDEVDNDRPCRFAHGLMAPFTRATWPSISMRGGNRAGDPGSAVPCISGQVSVLYLKLPTDW